MCLLEEFLVFLVVFREVLWQSGQLEFERFGRVVDLWPVQLGDDSRDKVGVELDRVDLGRRGLEKNAVTKLPKLRQTTKEIRAFVVLPRKSTCRK